MGTNLSTFVIKDVTEKAKKPDKPKISIAWPRWAGKEEYYKEMIRERMQNKMNKETIGCTTDDLIGTSYCPYFNSIRTFILEGKNAYEWMASLTDEEVCKIRNMEELPFSFSYPLSRFFGIWLEKTEVTLEDIQKNCKRIKSLARIEQINRIAKKHMGERFLVPACDENGNLPFNFKKTGVKLEADPLKCLISTHAFLDEVNVDPELSELATSILKQFSQKN